MHNSDITLQSPDSLLRIQKALTDFSYSSEGPFWGLHNTIFDFARVVAPLRALLELVKIDFTYITYITHDEHEYGYTMGHCSGRCGDLCARWVSRTYCRCACAPLWYTIVHFGRAGGWWGRWCCFWHARRCVANGRGVRGGHGGNGEICGLRGGRGVCPGKWAC